jgi:tetratricopeptide (TPR) repeat protein
VAAGLIFAQACWVGFSGAWPALAQEQQVLRAAELLRPAHENPGDVQLLLSTRQAAAATLLDAYEIWPANVKPLEAAAMQLELAGGHPACEQPTQLLGLAADLAERALYEHEKPSSLAIATSAHAQLGLKSGNKQALQPAIGHAQRMTELDPHGISSWKRLGDVLWLAGELDRAAAAYQRALANNDNFALDELKQLSPRSRSELERRIEQAVNNQEEPGR